MASRWLALALVLLLAGCAAPVRQDAARPAAPVAGPEEEPQGPSEEPAVSSTGTSPPSSRPTSSRPPPSSSGSPPPPPPPPPPAPGAGNVSNGPPWPEPHDYTQGVWFNWGKKDLTVAVVGVKDPVAGAAIARGIEIWEKGLATMAPDLGLKFTVHWSTDGPPPGINPDILVIPHGFMALYPGIAARCTATAPAPEWNPYMVHTAAHEFGHCLGLEHIFHDGVEYEPAEDIMGGGEGGHEPCPSNLNVAVLRMVFSGDTGELGIPQGLYLQAPVC